MRLYKDSDYPTVKAWWEAWGWTPVPEHALPRVGVIIEGVAAAWLYRTDSSIALIEWFVTNPNAKEGREEAKQAVIEALCGIAKEQGFRSAVTFVRNPHLLKSFEKSGFVGKTDGMYNLARSL